MTPTDAPPEVPIWFMVAVVIWLLWWTSVALMVVVTGLVLYGRRLVRCGPSAIWEPVLIVILAVSFLAFCNNVI